MIIWIKGKIQTMTKTKIRLSLKQAIKNDKLSDFIKQNQDIVGDKKKLDSALRSMSNNSKSTRQTSSEDSSEN